MAWVGVRPQANATLKGFTTYNLPSLNVRTTKHNPVVLSSSLLNQCLWLTFVPSLSWQIAAFFPRQGREARKLIPNLAVLCSFLFDPKGDGSDRADELQPLVHLPRGGPTPDCIHHGIRDGGALPAHHGPRRRFRRRRCAAWYCNPTGESRCGWVRQTAFTDPFLVQMIFSPRQARDGHRNIGKVETQKEGLSWFCRDLAPFGQRYRDVPLERCFAELHVEASLEARCASVEAFNARTRWQKRGLAVVPTVRHVSLGKAWDNQGLALLNLYTDGCVPKNAFLAHGFHYKETIGLPRQARDKRRKKG
jgi:hypothetical protein